LIQKGLSENPEHRFKSMQQALSKLERAPGVVVRKFLLFASLIMIIGFLAIVYFQKYQSKLELCQKAKENLVGVWDASTKKKIEQAFLSTNKPYAKDVFTRVEKRLGQYTLDWTTMHTQACRATHVLGQQSGKILDLRMNCLQSKLQKVAELIKLFSLKPDVEVLNKAVQAVVSLQKLERCSDVESLQAAYPLPEDPGVRKKVALVNKQLAQIEALEKAGKYKEGFAEIRKNLVTMGLVHQLKGGEGSPYLALTYKGQEIMARLIETAEMLESEAPE